MLINCLQPSPREFKPRQTRLLMGFVEFLNEISRTSTRNIALVGLFAILITGWRTWPFPYRSILADPFFSRLKIFQETSCQTICQKSVFSSQIAALACVLLQFGLLWMFACFSRETLGSIES